MRAPLLVAVLVFSTVVATCIFPTEQDGSVFVTIDSITAGPTVRKPNPSIPVVLLRGIEADAHATAWHKVGTSSQVVPNAVFVWSVSDTTRARIDPATGHIVAVNAGLTTVYVAAANYDKFAGGGTASIRVAAPLEVDSVRPRTVKFGGTITVYGVGTDSIVVADLGAGQLIPYPFSAKRDSLGYGRQTFWVPSPATSDSLFFIGNNVAGFARDSDTTHVVQADIYYPNTTAPATLNLTGSPPFPQLPTLLFYNPALYFEKLTRSQTVGADWYHLMLKTGDYTLVLHSRATGGRVLPFISDSVGFNNSTGKYFIGHDSWTMGPASHDCHGLAFVPPEAPSDSTVITLKGFAASALDLVAVYTAAGPYTLSVTSGLVPTASVVGFDNNEEDGNCRAADAHVQTLPFKLALTIAAPHAIDWIRFHLAAAGSVRFQMATTGTPDTSKDLDVYLVTVPGAGVTTLNAVAVDTTSGQNVDRTLALAAGDYYAVVLDYAGVVTPYELCVGGCTPFPTAGSAPTVAARHAFARRAMPTPLLGALSAEPASFPAGP